MNEKKARAYWEAVQALHRRQATLSDASRWTSLPYNHVSLVTDRGSAEALAARILGFADASTA